MPITDNKSKDEWEGLLTKGTCVMACLPIPDDWEDMNWDEMPQYSYLIGFISSTPWVDYGYWCVDVVYPNGHAWTWTCVSLKIIEEN